MSDRGGLEAGRGVLPTWWSWDGGHNWFRAGYDEPSRRTARAMTESASAAGEMPRCFDGPAGGLHCVDTNRVRTVDDRGAGPDLRGPEGCLHVRMTDSEHTYAFGPGCGLMYTPDHGGRWVHVLRSDESLPQWRGPGETQTARADGRGGFLDARTAWRIENGLWWTSDGGRSWRPSMAHLGRALEYGVFINRTHGVFATGQGRVMATQDGGRTWRNVMQGEIERISSAGRMVFVTSAQSVRVSPDGGATWWGPGEVPRAVRPDPTVEFKGPDREVALREGARVIQRDDTVWVSEAGASPAEQAIVTGTRHRPLLAAWSRKGRVEAVMLEGGAVLSRLARNGADGNAH
jgi:hypothetical protein